MVPLTAILAQEKQASDPHEMICWILLTDLPVEDTEAAIEKVQWYAWRWNIEVFHKILKSRCLVEQARLETAERLKKYIVLKSIVAWRLFSLTRLQEHDGQASCETVLDKMEWTLLYRKLNKTHRIQAGPLLSAFGNVLTRVRTDPHMHGMCSRQRRPGRFERR